MMDEEKLEKKSVGEGIFQVVIANAVNLVISLVSGFVIPRYLSIDAYANYKTFILFTSYCGLLHFGFVDGIYLKYGGKEYGDIDVNEFLIQQKVLLIMQFTVSCIGTIVSSILSNDYLLLAFMCALPTNMLMLYKFVFQATGKFGEYRKIVNLQALMTFVYNMFALLIMRIDDARIYCAGHIIINIFIMMYFYIITHMQIREKVRCNISTTFSMMKDMILSGAALMLGNFAVLWIANIDRWFVKAFCGNAEFAYYSFAVSMLKTVNVVLGAFAIALYNYFCQKKDIQIIASARKKIMIIGAIAIAIAFPLEFCVTLLLPKYVMAEDVMMVLIAAQLPLVVINAVYVNIFKAKGMQREYLYSLVIVSVFAILLDFLFGKIFGYYMVSYVYATFITMIFWLLLCQLMLPDYRMKQSELIYMILVSGVYRACMLINPILGFLIYILIIGLLSKIFFKTEVNDFFTILVRKFGKRII